MSVFSCQKLQLFVPFLNTFQKWQNSWQLYGSPNPIFDESVETTRVRSTQTKQAWTQCQGILGHNFSRPRRRNQKSRQFQPWILPNPGTHVLKTDFSCRPKNNRDLTTHLNSLMFTTSIKKSKVNFHYTFLRRDFLFSDTSID